MYKPHTSRLQHLPTALRAIGQRQRHNLIEPREFDLEATLVLSKLPFLTLTISCPQTTLTFSRMTKGPLTPPIVLYRMRGCTDIMRGSLSPAILAYGAPLSERDVELVVLRDGGGRGGMRERNGEVEVDLLEAAVEM